MSVRTAGQKDSDQPVRIARADLNLLCRKSHYYGLENPNIFSEIETELTCIKKRLMQNLFVSQFTVCIYD